MRLVHRAANVWSILALSLWLGSSPIAAVDGDSPWTPGKPAEGVVRAPVRPSRAHVTDGQAAPAPAGGQKGPQVSLDVLPQPVLFRQGPMTSNRRIMTADVRFRQTESVSLELPARAATRVDSARLLDRSGAPMPVTVRMGERTDRRTGQRWVTADVALAKLAPSDYTIEVHILEAPGDERTVATAIRVIE